MTNDEMATKLTETLLAMVKEQAARQGQDKTEFHPQELLVGVIGIASGCVNLIAHIAATSSGAVDGGTSLHPAYYRFVGTALFNAARDAEVSVASLAHLRKQAENADAPH